MPSRKNRRKAPEKAGPVDSAVVPSTIKTIRLLQIGDIHFPQWADVPTDIDHKDRGVAKALAKAISRDPIQTILRDIVQRVHFNRYNAITLMGDLTSWGNLDGYEAVLAQLTALFDVAHQIKQGRPMVLVPGNHDIQRVLALTPPIDKKFGPLHTLFDKYGWPQFPTHHVEKLPLPSGNGSVVLFPVNTCLGCGEKRNLPDAIRKKVEELVISAGSGPFNLDVASQIFEQLDTPAIDEKVIESLAQDITAMPKGALPVVVAHHNLLPQATPRLAPYTELINSGQLRRQLLRTGRQVLYLHGHIHDDPVEILRDPRHRDGKIVCVSAPAIESGYNEIEFYVSGSKGVLGCKIIPMRYKPGLGLNREPPIDIGLCGISEVSSPTSYRVMQVMLDKRSSFFDELLDKVTEDENFDHVSKSDLAVLAQELHFAGMLVIENPGDEPTAWHLRL